MHIKLESNGISNHSSQYVFCYKMLKNFLKFKVAGTDRVLIICKSNMPKWVRNFTLSSASVRFSFTGYRYCCSWYFVHFNKFLPILLLQLPTVSLFPQSERFRVTPYCIRSGRIIETLHDLPLIKCAVSCASTEGCRGFAYDRDSSSCQLGSVIVESGTTDSDCLPGESVYLSGKISPFQKLSYAVVA